ncbi:MAG: DUF975 family protein [Lachnospiraceae bacterium]
MSLHEISAGLKARGRYALAGHLGTAFGAILVYLILCFILLQMVNNVFSGDGVIFFILYEVVTWLVLTFAGLFSFGLCRIFMSWQYGQKAAFSDLFAGFRECTNTVLGIQAFLSGMELLFLLPSGIAGSFLVGNRGLLITILLEIAGSLLVLYLQLTYGLSYYILLDYPNGTPVQILRASRRMMKSNRGVLFYLLLSFIPLFLLGTLSLFVGDILVLAYFYSTEAAFYRSLMVIRSGARQKAGSAAGSTAT